MISIIIINDFDTPKYAQETISSIKEKIDNVEYEIIVINLKANSENDLKEGSKIYQLKTDNFAEAKNFGSSKSKYDFLLFLKAGIVVKINPFVHFFDKFKNRNFGAIGLKLYDFKNHFKITFWREIGLSEEVEENAVNKKIFQGNTQKALEVENRSHDIISVVRLSGDAMFINKKILTDIGGFNEYLGRYYYDADICKRLMKKKYVNYFYPFCKLVDLTLPEINTPLYLRSRLRYYKMHNSFVTRFILRISLIIKYFFLSLTFNKQNLHSLRSVLFPY